MADPRHAPPDGDGFLLSLARHLGAAVALVLVVAGAFWAIGEADGDPDGVVVADGPDEGAPTTGATDGVASPPAPTPPGDGTEASPDAPTATPTDTGSPTPTPTDSGTAPDAEPDTTSGSIPPGEVSIQVLDAVKQDGNTAASDLADRMESDGYNVVVVNPASKVYDVTTVFYSAGHEGAARQVAAAYGLTKVEEKPSNLSDSVWVHVVVGRDRA